MNHKKLKISVLLLFGLGLIRLQAQNTIYVKEKSGTQSQFTIGTIRKLTFADGIMTINNTDNTVITFAIGEIQYFNFNDLSTFILEASLQKNRNIILYPNPVSDNLKLSFETLKAENIHVEIVDIHGRVLHQQNIRSKKGINYVLISVSFLPEGLYIFRLQIGHQLENIKFFKN